jgi:hypothetical protein
MLWLPESPRFLAAQAEPVAAPCGGAAAPRYFAGGERFPRRCRAGQPGQDVFGRGYALQTVLLWIIYFCSLMNLFLFAIGCRRC